MHHDSTNQPDSRSPIPAVPTTQPATPAGADPGDKSTGAKVGEYALGMAEDTAKREAGKLLSKAFRWLGKRLGLVKDRSTADMPTHTCSEELGSTDDCAACQWDAIRASRTRP